MLSAVSLTNISIQLKFSYARTTPISLFNYYAPPKILVNIPGGDDVLDGVVVVTVKDKTCMLK